MSVSKTANFSFYVILNMINSSCLKNSKKWQSSSCSCSPFSCQDARMGAKCLKWSNILFCLTIKMLFTPLSNFPYIRISIWTAHKIICSVGKKNRKIITMLCDKCKLRALFTFLFFISSVEHSSSLEGFSLRKYLSNPALWRIRAKSLDSPC